MPDTFDQTRSIILFDSVYQKQTEFCKNKKKGKTYKTE